MCFCSFGDSCLREGWTVWAGLCGVTLWLCKYTTHSGWDGSSKGFSMTCPSEWSMLCQTRASSQSSPLVVSGASQGNFFYLFIYFSFWCSFCHDTSTCGFHSDGILSCWCHLDLHQWEQFLGINVLLKTAPLIRSTCSHTFYDHIWDRSLKCKRYYAVYHYYIVMEKSSKQSFCCNIHSSVVLICAGPIC